MAIYERGYRPYLGKFSTTRPAWFTIAREGWSIAFKHRGVRWMSFLVLVVFIVNAAIIFFQLNATQLFGDRLGADIDFGAMSLKQLRNRHWGFYDGTFTLASLSAVFVGCGLIADDLRSRAHTLYLSRPATRFSYVIGKALIIPGMFLVLCLLPGLMLWLMVGLWQPPGESMSFLSEHTDFALRAFKHFLLMSAGVTGLMLLLSSLTPRRGIAMAIGITIIILGDALAFFGRLLPGVAGEIANAFSLQTDVMREIRMVAESRHNLARHLPTERAVLIVTIGLLVLGLVAVWLRVRSTEVSE